MSSPNIFKRKLLSIAVLNACGLTQNVIAAEVSEQTIITAPVVITATRVETNSFDLPVSIDVVDAETLHENKAQVNLSEVSVRIPGVIVNNRFNASQDLSISTRGFGSRSQFGVRGVRLYADGIPLTMPDGQGQTGTFNLDTAKQIEFMRGPFSALYGNSSGGVVQIITKDGSKDTTASAGITFGSFNTKRETLTYEGENGPLNYIINATNLTSDGYRDHSKSTKENLHTKLSYTIDDATKLTLLATYNNQPDTEDPLGLSPAQYRLNPTQAGTDAVARNTRVSKQHTQAGVILDHAFSDQNSIKFMGYYGVRDNEQFQTLGLTGRVSAISRDFGGFDARWNHKDTLAGLPFTFSAGVNYDNMTDDRRQYNASQGILIPGETRSEIQNVYNFDQFAQATFEPTNRWLLIAGIRHSEVNFKVTDKMPVITGNPDGSGAMTYSNTSPVLGATFKLTPAVNLYANYGSGFETPTFIELTYKNASTGTGPNLTIQPSKSKNYEVGIKAFILDNTRVNLALFKVKTEKEIVTDTGTGSTASFKNAGDTERNGLEASLDSILPYNFRFYAAYTLMNAKFKDAFTSNGITVNANNKIPGTYTSTTYAELSWRHQASGFTTAVECIHFSDTYAYDTNDGLTKTNPFTLLNLRAGFVQKTGHWRFNEFVRIDNFTDRTYVSSVKINTSAAFEPGASRNWTLGLNTSYQF